MATDWIKMRTNLWNDPRVAGMVDATDSSEREVIGALYWLWATADEHTQDGVLVGMSLRQLDRKTGLIGFGDALVAAGWAAEVNNGIRIERFSEHNGQSAKSRALTAKRVGKLRASTPDVCCNDGGVTPPLHGRNQEQEQDQEEKQQQEHVQPAAAPEGDSAQEQGQKRAPAKRTAERFRDFWGLYPVKKGKAAAEKSWRSRNLDPKADVILAHVRRMLAEDHDWKRGFIPHGSTYINGERWEDEPKRDPATVTVPPPAPEKIGAKAALAPSESKLQNTIGYIVDQHRLGAYGEGPEADAERDRLIAEAKEKHGRH